MTGPVCPVLPRHKGVCPGDPRIFSDQAEHSDLDLGGLWGGEKRGCESTGPLGIVNPNGGRGHGATWGLAEPHLATQ